MLRKEETAFTTEAKSITEKVDFTEDFYALEPSSFEKPFVNVNDRSDVLTAVLVRWENLKTKKVDLFARARIQVDVRRNGKVCIIADNVPGHEFETVRVFGLGLLVKNNYHNVVYLLDKASSVKLNGFMESCLTKDLKYEKVLRALNDRKKFEETVFNLRVYESKRQNIIFEDLQAKAAEDGLKLTRAIHSKDFILDDSKGNVTEVSLENVSAYGIRDVKLKKEMLAEMSKIVNSVLKADDEGFVMVRDEVLDVKSLHLVARLIWNNLSQPKPLLVYSEKRYECVEVGEVTTVYRVEFDGYRFVKEHLNNVVVIPKGKKGVCEYNGELDWNQELINLPDIPEGQRCDSSYDIVDATSFRFTQTKRLREEPDDEEDDFMKFFEADETTGEFVVRRKASEFAHVVTPVAVAAPEEGKVALMGRDWFEFKGDQWIKITQESVPVDVYVDGVLKTFESEEQCLWFIDMNNKRFGRKLIFKNRPDLQKYCVENGLGGAYGKFDGTIVLPHDRGYVLIPRFDSMNEFPGKFFEIDGFKFHLSDGPVAVDTSGSGKGHLVTTNSMSNVALSEDASFPSLADLVHNWLYNEKREVRYFKSFNFDLNFAIDAALTCEGLAEYTHFGSADGWMILGRNVCKDRKTWCELPTGHFDACSEVVFHRFVGLDSATVYVRKNITQMQRIALARLGVLKLMKCEVQNDVEKLQLLLRDAYDFVSPFLKCGQNTTVLGDCDTIEIVGRLETVVKKVKGKFTWDEIRMKDGLDFFKRLVYCQSISEIGQKYLIGALEYAMMRFGLLECNDADAELITRVRNLAVEIGVDEYVTGHLACLREIGLFHEMARKPSWMPDWCQAWVRQFVEIGEHAFESDVPEAKILHDYWVAQVGEVKVREFGQIFVCPIDDPWVMPGGQRGTGPFVNVQDNIDMDFDNYMGLGERLYEPMDPYDHGLQRGDPLDIDFYDDDPLDDSDSEDDRWSSRLDYHI